MMNTKQHKATQHNTKIETLAPFQIAEADTIGITLNWTLPDTATPVSALESAMRSEGLAPKGLPAETTGLMRLRQLVVYQSARIYRRQGRRVAREFVHALIKQTSENKHLTSYSYSANMARAEEKSRLEQVGSITYNAATRAYHWRFVADKMNKGESLNDYIDRALELMPEFEREDLEFFAKFADETLSEVHVYATSPHYDVVRLRDILREELERVRCYRLTDRGGMWFVPRTGRDDCPYAHMQAVMRAFSEAVPRAKFHLLTLPRDAQSMQTAGEIVASNILTQIAEIETKVEEAKRLSSLDARKFELDGLLSQAALFESILGMMGDDLRSRIVEVQDMIRERNEAALAAVTADAE